MQLNKYLNSRSASVQTFKFENASSTRQLLRLWFLNIYRKKCVLTFMDMSKNMKPWLYSSLDCVQQLNTSYPLHFLRNPVQKTFGKERKALKEDRLSAKLYCYTVLPRFHVSWLFISGHSRTDMEKTVFALVSRRGRKEKYLGKTIKAHPKKKDYDNSCQLFFKEKKHHCN